MTRQKIERRFYKLGNNIIVDSFAQKILKKIELYAFDSKVKIIKSYIPEKVKLFIENKLTHDTEYLEKKYSFKINFSADEKLIIPEYKIEFLNKSKKIIKHHRKYR